MIGTRAIQRAEASPAGRAFVVAESIDLGIDLRSRTPRRAPRNPVRPCLRAISRGVAQHGEEVAARTGDNEAVPRRVRIAQPGVEREEDDACRVRESTRQ